MWTSSQGYTGFKFDLADDRMDGQESAWFSAELRMPYIFCSDIFIPVPTGEIDSTQSQNNTHWKTPT